MSDAMLSRVSEGWGRLATRLVHLGRQTQPPREGSFVNLPVSRGSTVLYPDLQAMDREDGARYNHELVYGAMGSPIQHELERVIAAIEGGTHCQIVSSGLTACALPLLAFLHNGDHLLLPDSVYGPTRRLAETMLKRLGIITTFYPAQISEHALEALIQERTRVIFAESPGSHTFEVQDVAQIARVAHRHNAKLVLDNTWGIGIFQPFDHGVDVSVQALTKYPAGHSDLVAGAVSVASEATWHPLRDCAIQLGLVAGPDDCWLTLRGVRTMAARLERQSQSALLLARWLAARPEISQVRHPALPSCPGHALWLRDFSGASALFGVALNPDYTKDALRCFVEALHLFGIGASWGGYESLILPTTGHISRNFADAYLQGQAFRLHVGLEDINDLKEDLERGFAALEAVRGS